MTRIARRARLYMEGVSRLRRAARETYHVPWTRLWRRALHLRRAHGFAMDEALAMGLLDPARGETPAALSKRETLALQRRLNRPRLEALTENKLAFARLAVAAGLAVPRTVGALAAEGTAWTEPAGDGDLVPWEALLAALPGECVVKPVWGYHGEGLRVLRPAGDGIEVNGVPHAVTALAAELRADAAGDDWLVQERVRNHP
ncbi:MAG TPA: sugar-transfer associated ATP-grasp domain-containing protein, partial [Miltoncostaeaceae bacterium]|nr:sugar-transfer associated ATP-grasp domain-containing protein [Miltoncostaeaceae bacterium]